jgi:membrane-bound inhibitor of C-type lysozyme
MRILLFGFSFALAFMLTLVGAYGSNDEASPAATVIGSTTGVTLWRYSCANGKSFEALYYPMDQGRATLSVDGQTIEMTQTTTGSGALYRGDTLSLRTKGTDALIKQGEVTLFSGCEGSEA